MLDGVCAVGDDFELLGKLLGLGGLLRGGLLGALRRGELLVGLLEEVYLIIKVLEVELAVHGERALVGDAVSVAVSIGERGSAVLDDEFEN